MNKSSKNEIEKAFKELITREESSIFESMLGNICDEDYVWMNQSLMRNEGLNDNLMRNEYMRFANVNDIKDKTLQQLSKIRDLKNIKNHIANSKKYYFPASHLENIRGDSKKIFIAIILLQLEVLEKAIPTIRKSSDDVHYKNNDQYLFLLFILYYEIPEKYINEAIQIINDVPRYLEEISTHNVNLSKYMNNNDFIEWCYVYLKKKKGAYVRYLDYAALAVKNSQEKRIFIENILNLFYINADTEKLKYIQTVNAIKRAWQQKSFREGAKTKHKYHLPITVQAKTQLKELAVFKNMTDGELLSKLIGDAFLKEMCDENGKKIY
ncbi:hypothetical protein [Acinetobacter johnsonii]|uniref:hypothetical protein n=1 Tax=Acinetobacter johnsonii TaxID=40214 RepID=UPI00216838D4|nr:hypothetical protein [Acinetobacter johnsonii]MCS3527772.1 hypothetical protein [Acinetobacter johnsonii]